LLGLRTQYRSTQADTEHPPHQEAERGERRSDSDKADVLAERGEHQVGVSGRNHLRVADAWSKAADAAGGQRPERVRDLIAARQRVLPRIDPHRHSLRHRAGDAERVADDESGDEDAESTEDQRHASTRHAIQPEKYARQDECWTEILLQEEERQEGRDGDGERPHVLPARQPQER